MAVAVVGADTGIVVIIVHFVSYCLFCKTVILQFSFI